MNLRGLVKTGVTIGVFSMLVSFGFTDVYASDYFQDGIIEYVPDKVMEGNTEDDSFYYVEEEEEDILEDREMDNIEVTVIKNSPVTESDFTPKEDEIVEHEEIPVRPPVLIVVQPVVIEEEVNVEDTVEEEVVEEENEVEESQQEEEIVKDDVEEVVSEETIVEVKKEETKVQKIEQEEVIINKKEIANQEGVEEQEVSAGVDGVPLSEAIQTGDMGMRNYIIYSVMALFGMIVLQIIKTKEKVVCTKICKK